MRSGRKRQRDIAILCSTNGTATTYEIALRGAGLKVNRLGAPPFLELALPRAFLSWCVLAVDDDLEALEDVKNAPTKRYLGHAFLPTIMNTEANDLIHALRIVTPKYKGAADIAAIMTKLRRLRRWDLKVNAVKALFASTLVPTAKGPRAQLEAIASITKRLTGPDDVWAMVNAPATPSDDGVVVSTVHRAKGLEWDTVYADASKGAYHRKDDSPKDQDEAGRLAYVACTRPKDELVIISAGLMSPLFESVLDGATA